MNLLKFRQFVVILGTFSLLTLAAPGADASAARIKSPLANPAWMPLYDYEALDVKPRPLVQAAPLYPPGLKEVGAKAKVTVEFIIGKQGNVEAAQILSSTDPRFNETCIAAAMKWRFTIPKKNSAAVYCRVSQSLGFE